MINRDLFIKTFNGEYNADSTVIAKLYCGSRQIGFEEIGIDYKDNKENVPFIVKQIEDKVLGKCSKENRAFNPYFDFESNEGWTDGDTGCDEIYFYKYFVHSFRDNDGRRYTARFNLVDTRKFNIFLDNYKEPYKSFINRIMSENDYTLSNIDILHEMFNIGEKSVEEILKNEWYNDEPFKGVHNYIFYKDIYSNILKESEKNLKIKLMENGYNMEDIEIRINVNECSIVIENHYLNKSYGLSGHYKVQTWTEEVEDGK